MKKQQPGIHFPAAVFMLQKCCKRRVTCIYAALGGCRQTCMMKAALCSARPALHGFLFKHAFHIFVAQRTKAVGCEDPDRSFVVGDTEDHACTVGLFCQECIGVLQIDPVVSKQVQNVYQGTRLVFEDDRQNLGQGAYITLILQDLDGLEGIIDNHSYNAEILRLCKRQGAKVDLIVLQDFRKCCPCSAPPEYAYSIRAAFRFQPRNRQAANAVTMLYGHLLHLIKH